MRRVHGRIDSSQRLRPQGRGRVIIKVNGGFFAGHALFVAGYDGFFKWAVKIRLRCVMQHARRADGLIVWSESYTQIFQLIENFLVFAIPGGSGGCESVGRRFA
jgi:hypothetical protein